MYYHFKTRPNQQRTPSTTYDNAENYYNSPPPTTTNGSPISRPQVVTPYANYCTMVRPPPAYTPVHNSESQSLIRYNISLEAQTAVVQKGENVQLTYLNKGQYYNITMRDQEQYDGEIESTIAISFHHENHRTSAADYWKYWLAQHASDAKAVELDTRASIGIQTLDESKFDRISFKWNGKVGATISLCFNCLSTDFSRIKGVKGVPLRLQAESVPCDFPAEIEKTFCRIKLFRDKGAQRKNKDDAEHVERKMRKMYCGGPSMQYKAATSPVTFFTEIMPTHEEDTLPPPPYMTLPYPQSPQLPTIRLGKRPFSQLQGLVDHATLSPSIIPHRLTPRRHCPAKLCLFVKFHESDIYRAIYLDQLTLTGFISKVSQRIQNKKPIVNVYRKKKNVNKALLVEIDDEAMEDLKEEQDMYIETVEHLDSIDLILNF